MHASKAHEDPDPADRLARIERMRDEYVYDHDYLAPICVVQELPKAEAFTTSYYLRRLAQTRQLIPNSVFAWLRTKLSRLQDPEDISALFATLPRPEVATDWRSDESFARQRFCGSNPMRIRRVLHSDEVPFDVPDAALQTDDGRVISIADRVAAGRLYLSDYRDLSMISGGNYGGVQRFMPAPCAVFHLDADGQLKPLAIELKAGGTVRDPHTTTPLDWLAAKIWLQIADGNDMELGSHLARTHLVMEPFGITTPRQLDQNHPLSILLRPHLSFMLANTRLGQQILLAPGSLADQLCAGSLAGSKELVINSYKGWSLETNSFPADLSARNLDDRELLPDFPFRDDGQLLWEAIHQFVTDYLAIYYPASSDVTSDAELQAWAAELASWEGGRVKDMPGQIETREQLRDILTTVLFTCGPQHAVVNYGQYPFLSFVPNMPLAAYCDLDPARGPVSFERESDLMHLLPPPTGIRRQLQVMNLLSAYHNDRLGHYSKGQFSDPQALGVIDQFQQRLAEIETLIEARNDDRRVPYDLLKPSMVPNSISI